MAKIMYDSPGKYAAIILENEKDISAMISIIALAAKAKPNKQSNVWKLLDKIDGELPIT